MVGILEVLDILEALEMLYFQSIQNIQRIQSFGASWLEYGNNTIILIVSSSCF